MSLDSEDMRFLFAAYSGILNISTDSTVMRKSIHFHLMLSFPTVLWSQSRTAEERSGGRRVYVRPYADDYGSITVRGRKTAQNNRKNVSDFRVYFLLLATAMIFKKKKKYISI